MSKKPPPGTQSVLRAVALLKALGEADGDVDLSRLSTAVGLARTTTHRLLSALESEGLVTRDPDRHTYRLGPAAIVMGARALRANDLRTTVRPFLQRLAEETGETTTFEVLCEGRVLILDEVLGEHLLGTTPSIGTSWELHATSTGKALLAALSPARRAALLRGPLRRLTPHTIRSRAALERELERIAACGYATAEEELTPGFSAAAAVVYDALAEPVGAIAVNGPVVRLSGPALERAAQQALTAARDASRALGYDAA